MIGIGAFRVLAAVVLWLAFAVTQPLVAQIGVWRAEGPAPETGGQVEGITDREVVGAVQAIAPHPTNANTLYIGAVNGGVWRTDDALAASPTWVARTDQQSTLSIGALEFDPTDPSNQTLVAGTGRFSNIGRAGGGTGAGILRTTDGGTTWTPLGQAALAGTNISGVTARGSTIVVSDTLGGIWRSTDTGVIWTQISGLPGSGLPAGGAFDLAGVPGAQATLYANAGNSGVFRSTDTGATWALVSNAAMNALIPVSNMRISALGGNVVFVAIANGGTLAGVFRSGNGGATWATMDLPQTTEAGGGIQGIHPGGQAGINLSLAADPNDATGNTVYIGGDRQPGPPAVAFPNAIGASNFSGRLFRGNAGQPAGQQFVHLTHSNSRGPAGGGTANGSAPHADSRNMAFDANGNLIEGDDGGVYRRTLPQSNAGVWVSLNGNLQNTEFHSVAWDAVANRIIGGAQDVGTPEQEEFGEPEWEGATQADGGVVAVDDISAPGLSTRFFSTQNLNNLAPSLNTRSYDADNALVSTATAPLSVLSGGAAINPQFYTPVVVNNANGTSLVIGAANSVYESLDSGQTVTAIGPGIVANSSLQGEAIAYGAADNANMLYVGSGAQVFVRSGASPGSLLAASATYPGVLNVVDVAIDPNASQTAYVVDQGNVFQTLDGGGTWTNITGNLFAAFSPGQLRSVDVVSLVDLHAVVVGTDRGVFWADALPALEWSVPCQGLPNAPVSDLEFDESDEILLAGTLGRGAWTCAPQMPRPTTYEVKYFCGEGDNAILGAGDYRTAINILNRDDPDAAPATYRRRFAVGLPGETTGGQTVPRSGGTLKPGEAAEIDCDDILREGMCAGGICKGFARIDSPAPLEIVAVYSTANPKTDTVSDLQIQRQTTPGSQCKETTLTVPERTELFVPPHTQGDREFDGHGPCVHFSLDLRAVDDGSALAADYDMQAFECSGSFASPQSDFTAAAGQRSEIVASAGPGGEILGFSVDAHLVQDYIDTNHADDVFTFAGTEPVSSLRFVGDTSGSEAGTKSGVFLTFRPVEVRMRTCSVPSNAG